MSTRTILAVSGSLRRASANQLVIRAVGVLAPAAVRIVVCDLVGELPHFNPDLDGDAPPATVAELRRQVASADALLISSPEYAHGVPGALKNALDWLVPCVEFPGKPVLLLNASAGDAVHLQQQLIEILTTMSARVVARHPLVSAAVRRHIGEDGAVADAQLAQAIRGGIDALLESLPSR